MGSMCVGISRVLSFPFFPLLFQIVKKRSGGKEIEWTHTDLGSNKAVFTRLTPFLGFGGAIKAISLD